MYTCSNCFQSTSSQWCYLILAPTSPSTQRNFSLGVSPWEHSLLLAYPPLPRKVTQSFSVSPFQQHVPHERTILLLTSGPSQHPAASFPPPPAVEMNKERVDEAIHSFLPWAIVDTLQTPEKGVSLWNCQTRRTIKCALLSKQWCTYSIEWE